MGQFSWYSDGLDGRDSNLSKDTTFFFSTTSTPALGSAQPPNQWVPGTISIGVQQPGHEADHSPPSNVEVKNGGAMPPLLQISSWHSA
jgi:hypothetical protein